MRKSYFLLTTLFVGFLMVFSLQIPGFAQDQVVSKDMFVAAQKGIKHFLKNLDPKILLHFGFSNQAEVDAAVIDEGFQLNSFYFSEGHDSSQLQNLSSLSVPKECWNFIVMKKDQAVALITIAKRNDQWAPVSIGCHGLAKQLQKILESWPRVDGYRLKHIRISRFKSDFVEIQQKGKSLGLIPLSSAKLAMGLDVESFNAQVLFSPEEIATGYQKIRESL